MIVCFNGARMWARWIVGAQIGFLGTFVLLPAMSARAALTQITPDHKSIEKTASRSDASALTPTGSGKPAIVKVEKRPIRIEVTLTGVFEATRVTEVSIRPTAWSFPLTVDRAIGLGTPVRKGDILVEFDHEKIDKAIEDMQVENATGDLALKQAEEEIPILEKALPVDLAAALRAKTQADEDLTKFLEIDRAQSERNAQFMVKRSVEFLEYAREELRQLEKMYRSKDLTEETEEIILRRQRFQVESSEFNLKESQLRQDQTLKIDLPRREQRERENVVKLTIELEKARVLLPLNLNQKRIALAKLRHDRAKSVEKLANLRRDRDMFTVHAPSDGLVYYGRCERATGLPLQSLPSFIKGGSSLRTRYSSRSCPRATRYPRDCR